MEEQEVPVAIHNNENLEKLIKKRIIKREESNSLFLKKDTHSRCQTLKNYFYTLFIHHSYIVSVYRNL